MWSQSKVLKVAEVYWRTLVNKQPQVSLRRILKFEIKTWCFEPIQSIIQKCKMSDRTADKVMDIQLVTETVKKSVVTLEELQESEPQLEDSVEKTASCCALYKLVSNWRVARGGILLLVCKKMCGEHRKLVEDGAVVKWDQKMDKYCKKIWQRLQKTIGWRSSQSPHPNPTENLWQG